MSRDFDKFRLVHPNCFCAVDTATPWVDLGQVAQGHSQDHIDINGDQYDAFVYEGYIGKIWGIPVVQDDLSELIEKMLPKKEAQKISESPVFVSSIMMDGEDYDLEDVDME